MTEVFIPKKRNKEGKSFGFARFFGVRDKRRLEDNLRNVWFRTYQVFQGKEW